MGDFMDWLSGSRPHHAGDNDAGRTPAQRKKAAKYRREQAAKAKKKKAAERGRVTKGSDSTWWSW